jgi:predicted RecB family nuclease
MQQALLADLAKQAKQVYSKEVPTMQVEMTGKCGFCQFINVCKSSLSEAEKQSLFEAEARYAQSQYAGKYAHNNLRNYLEGVSE